MLATFCGEVIHGAGRGHTLGFPTANLAVGEPCTLEWGVYVSEVTLSDGRVVEAVSNLGVHPTFSKSEKLLLETYFLSETALAYGERITVKLLCFLRPERRFSEAEVLCRQIDEDVRRARAYFRQEKSPQS